METLGMVFAVLAIPGFAVGAVLGLYGFLATVMLTANSLLTKSRPWEDWGETSHLWAGGIVSALFGVGMLALMAAAKFLHTL